MLHDSIAGDFHNKATIGASALLCVQWQNLDGESFDMLYKNDCLAAIPDPIWTINVPYERKINMLSCTEISFVISFFNFEKFWVKPGFPVTQLNRANTQNLERKIIAEQSCYPICVTNVSYEREIIVLSFPVISFGWHDICSGDNCSGIDTSPKTELDSWVWLGFWLRAG